MNNSTNSTTSSSKFKKVLASTLIAGTAALTLGASAAHAQSPTPVDNHPRIERACARIPNAQTRIDKAIERINGGADTRGSLLWLDAKIQQATNASRTDLATALTNRKEVRSATLGVLELRKANLVELANLCAAQPS